MALATLSFHQATVWHDDVALWRQAATVSHTSKAWLNLGSALVLAGDDLGARDAYYRGLRLTMRQPGPDPIALVVGWANLALMDARHGDILLARQELRDLSVQYPNSHVIRTACSGVRCLERPSSSR